MGTESQLAMSIGSFLGVIGLFYQWHKDSKETAQKIQKLETEVDQLKEHKEEIREIKSEIGEMKQDLNKFSQVITRIDTNVEHLMKKPN